jgi:hypothetical protein
LSIKRTSFRACFLLNLAKGGKFIALWEDKAKGDIHYLKEEVFQ